MEDCINYQDAQGGLNERTREGERDSRAGGGPGVAEERESHVRAEQNV